MNKKFKLNLLQLHSFTMAEILLSLTIIGIVAAITLPSLTGNINERTWSTQKKALYARMSQAIALMGSLNGYGLNADNNQTISNAAKVFVTDGLRRVLKINNICDSEHFKDCGLPSKITTMGNEVINFPNKLSDFNSMLTGYTNGYGNPQINTNAAAFETANGESIAVYYNPNCTGRDTKFEQIVNTTGWSEYKEVIYAQSYMCANFVYDLNGKKGPNVFGKDLGFITALYSTDPAVVAPVAVSRNASDGFVTFYEARSLCTQKDPESRIPNIEEMNAMVYNSKFLSLVLHNNNYSYWTSTVYDNNFAWSASKRYLARTAYRMDTELHIRCIKK